MQAAVQPQLNSQPQRKRPQGAARKQWGPICCKQDMHEMVRRAILRSDGSVVYCSVWHCLNCGRLLL